jgi:predicted CopG family antitoxin
MADQQIQEQQAKSRRWKVINVSAEVYEKLREIKEKMRKELNKEVKFDEVIRKLLEKASF